MRNAHPEWRSPQAACSTYAGLLWTAALLLWHQVCQACEYPQMEHFSERQNRSVCCFSCSRVTSEIAEKSASGLRGTHGYESGLFCRTLWFVLRVSGFQPRAIFGARHAIPNALSAYELPRHQVIYLYRLSLLQSGYVASVPMVITAVCPVERSALHEGKTCPEGHIRQ